MFDRRTTFCAIIFLSEKLSGTTLNIQFGKSSVFDKLYIYFDLARWKLIVANVAMADNWNKAAETQEQSEIQRLVRICLSRKCDFDF